jgi:uncharacterized protein (TIGR02466 family)
MTTPYIDLFFPKSALVVDDIQLDNIDTFLKRIDELSIKHGTIRDEMLNIDSSHGTHSKLHLDPIFEPLVKSIKEMSRIYLTEYGYDHTYIDSINISNMWFNKSKKDDTVEAHLHQNCILSGVFYLQTPTGSQLRFHDFTNNYQIPTTITKLSMNFKWYDCIPGRLIMFKSDMPHSTNKQPDGDRTIISFNMKERL